MKKQSPKFWRYLLSSCVVLAMGLGLEAKAVCPVEVYTNGNHTINVLYEQVELTEYLMTITSTESMTGFGGTFVSTSYGNYNLSTYSNKSISADGHTIRVSLESTVAPDVYTPLYVMIGGEVSFGQHSVSWCLEPRINLTITPNEDELALDWSPFGFETDPSQFMVEYSSDGGTNWTTASATATSPYTITGLASHSSYRVRVSGTSGPENATVVKDVVTFPLAPTYSHPENLVLSVYSTQYGEDIAGAEQDSRYSNATNGTLSIDENHTIKVLNLAGSGGANVANGMLWFVDNLGANIVKYDSLHVDLYIPDNAVTRTITKIRFYAGEREGNAIDMTDITLGAWNSYDMPVASFNRNNTGRLCIIPMVDDGYPDSPYVVYLDNYFFYNPEIPLPPTYDFFPEDVLSIYSTQYGEEVAGAYQGAAWSDAANATFDIDATHTVKKYSMRGGGNANKGILWILDNLGASFGDYDKLHVDIFIPDDAVTRTITKIAFWGGELNGTPVYKTSLTLNAWNSFDIPISSFGRSNTNRMCIVPMVGDGYPTSPYTLYMDNYFIYNDESCEFSKEMLNVQNTTRIEGAGVMIYFEGYGTEYAQNAALYTVTARATGGAMTPNIQAATAEYLYVTLGRAPGANELTEITLTHQDGAAVKMKFQGGTLISTRDVCGQCPDSPEPEFIESSADKKHLYVSRYTTVNNFTDLHSQYSSATCTTNETAGGLDVLKFHVIRRNACTPNSATLLYSTNAMFADVTDMDYIHLDIYLPDNGTVDSHYLRFGLQENYIVYPQEFVLGEWNSFDIPLNAINLNFAALTNFRLSIDPVADLNGTAPTLPYNMYVDNVYFYADASCSSSPAAAAATPEMPESAVVSLFSDAYTTGVASFRTNDGTLFNQNNSAELVQIGGNNTYFYDNIYHLAFEFSSVDITAMHGMSVDLWAEKPMTIDIRGGNGNTNQQFGKFELHCGWNHVEFDITDAQKTSMSNAMTQLYIHAPGPDVNLSIPADIYLDNLYFFQEPLVIDLTKRLAVQKVCHVQTDANIRRIQVYSSDQATKYIDVALDTPASSYDLDIRELAVGTYKVLIYDTEGRIADVKAVHVVY